MTKQKARRDRKAPTTALPDYGAEVAAARPKVQELLAEYRADPSSNAGTILETLVLNQLAGELGREAEALVQQERGRRQNLKDDSGRGFAALARQNRRLKRDLARKDGVQATVIQYLEQVGAAARIGREPSREQIIQTISEAIGVRGPLIERVEKGPVPHA